MPQKGYKATPQAVENNRLAQLGKTLSEEHKQKISRTMKGVKKPWFTHENHPKWKGDNISVRSLHRWVRNHLPMPELCEICYKVPPYDLANITGIYNREFKNWKYFCRRCHLYHDGHIKYLELGRGNHNSYKVAREITDK